MDALLRKTLISLRNIEVENIKKIQDNVEVGCYNFFKDKTTELKKEIKKNNNYSKKQSLILNVIFNSETDELYDDLFKLENKFYYLCGYVLMFLNKNREHNLYFKSSLSNSKIKYMVYSVLIKINMFENYSDQLLNDLSIIKENYMSGELEDLFNTKPSFMVIIFLKYFLLQNLEINFNNKFERKVAHYTNLTVAEKIIKGETLMRLSSTEFMNDPSEGKILSQFLINQKSELSDSEERTFCSCFTFNHNSLNQFRLYGRTNHIECSGISLTIDKNFFKESSKNQINTYRCVYLEKNTNFIKIASRNKLSFFQEYEFEERLDIEKMWNKYKKLIYLKELVTFDCLSILREFINESCLVKLYSSDVIMKNLHEIQFIIKHSSFNEEDECRSFKKVSLSNNEVKYFPENNTTYIDNPIPLHPYIKNIYLGVSIKELKTYIQYLVSKQNHWNHKPVVKVSDAPFRAHEIINRIKV